MEYGEGKKIIEKYLAKKKTIVYEDLVNVMKKAGYKDPAKNIWKLRHETDLLRGKTITKPIGPSIMRPDQIIGFGGFKGKEPGFVKFKLPKHRRRFIEILTDYTKDDTSKWLTSQTIAKEFNTDKGTVEKAFKVMREKIPKLQQGTEKNRSN